MNKQSDLLESYYEHGCSVSYEKDVLDTDIKGKGSWAYLKRWWYNLFLLSYADERSRGFYMSSHAMKMERARQFRYYRRCIHPLSQFRNFWDCLILNVVLINIVIFHHNTSVIFGQLARPFYFIAVFLEIIILIDIFINSRTGYIDKEARKIVLDSKKVLLKYCSTKLFIHTASAIPLESIMFLRYGSEIDCASCKSNYFVSALKFISICSVFRIYDASVYWTRERRSFRATYFFKFLRIGVLGLVTMLQILNFSDTLSVLDLIRSGKFDSTSFFQMILQFKYKKERPPNIVFFCYEFSRICKSFLLFGYGLQPNENDLDKVSSLLAFLVTNIFYMWSVLECYVCLSRVNFPDDQIILNEDRTINMLRCRQLPDIIRYKVKQYYSFTVTKKTVIEEQNGLYQSLPMSLKREIALNCYGRRVSKLTFFREWNPKIFEEVVMMLRSEVYLKGDVVSNSWSQGDGLIIIDAGIMAVYSARGAEVGHLIDGDYFGELSLVTDKELRMSLVVAVTHCEVLILEKTVFRKFMRRYPELFFELKQKLREKYGNVANDSFTSESSRFEYHPS